MLNKDNFVLIKGGIPFNNKKERMAAWKQLKGEFGDNVRIIIKDQIMSYTCKVDRSLYL